MHKPSLFAEWAIQYFPKNGKITDIGGGQGQDSVFFANAGYNVTLIDISKKAFEYAKKQIPRKLKNQIHMVETDISKPLPLENDSVDVAYAHLTLHYFNHKTTRKIFEDIYRILKPEGIVVALFNSINDPEYNQGKEIEPDVFEIDGIAKRYFSVKTLKPFVEMFEVIILDNKGETYKDSAKGIHNLIRFVGRKKFLATN